MIKKITFQKPELLCPAGSLEKLELAYRYGADACYMGTAAFSMRTRENQVCEDELIRAKEIAKQYGKQLFIAVNVFPRNFHLQNLKKHLLFLKKLKPDALIVADPGIIDICKQIKIGVPLHLSVQNSTANWQAVKFWQRQGIKRIVLARELSLVEIAEIKKQVPKMELESFVHGSICMAYSGRCFLSNYFRKRDANCGMCAHSCREKYRLTDYHEAEIHAEEKTALVEEVRHPDRQLVIEEDVHGSHLMSSKDMCLLPHLREISEAGVECYKVEGRNKSEYYLSVVTRTYRKAIDEMMKGKKFEDTLLREMKKTKNRGFFSGFYFPELKEESEEYEDLLSSDGQRYYVGRILEVDVKNQLLKVEMKNKLKARQKVRLLSEQYGKEKILTISKVGSLKNADSAIIESTPKTAVSGGIYAVLKIKEKPQKKWEGLLLQFK